MFFRLLICLSPRLARLTGSLQQMVGSRGTWEVLAGVASARVAWGACCEMAVGWQVSSGAHGASPANDTMETVPDLSAHWTALCLCSIVPALRRLCCRLCPICTCLYLPGLPVCAFLGTGSALAGPHLCLHPMGLRGARGYRQGCTMVDKGQEYSGVAERLPTRGQQPGWLLVRACAHLLV